MPRSLNGIGTMFYGRREPGSDGYITTKWFVFAFLPLIPLRSYRVRPTGEGSSAWLLVASTSSQSYLVQRVPLSWRQVGNVYSVVAGILLLVSVAAFVL